MFSPEQTVLKPQTHHAEDDHSNRVDGYERDSANDAQHSTNIPTDAEGEFMWIKNKRRASGAAAETYRKHMEARNNETETPQSEQREENTVEDRGVELRKLSQELDVARAAYAQKRVSLGDRMKRLTHKLGLAVGKDVFGSAQEELDIARRAYADAQQTYYNAILQKELPDADAETAEIFVRSLNVSEGANVLAAEDAARMEAHPLSAQLRAGIKNLIDKYRSIDWKRRVAAGAVASLGTGGAFKVFSLASLYSGIKDKLDARAQIQKTQDVYEEVAYRTEIGDDAKTIIADAVSQREAFAREQEHARAKRAAKAAAMAAGVAAAGSAIGSAVADAMDSPVRNVDKLISLDSEGGNEVVDTVTDSPIRSADELVQAQKMEAGPVQPEVPENVNAVESVPDSPIRSADELVQAQKMEAGPVQPEEMLSESVKSDAVPAERPIRSVDEIIDAKRMEYGPVQPDMPTDVDNTVEPKSPIRGTDELIDNQKQE